MTITDTEAVDALKPLRVHVTRQAERAEQRGHDQAAHVFRREVDALERAMSMLGSRAGAAELGRVQAAFSSDELSELGRLVTEARLEFANLADDDERLELLDRCRARLAATLRRALQLELGVNVTAAVEDVLEVLIP